MNTITEIANNSAITGFDAKAGMYRTAKVASGGLYDYVRLIHWRQDTRRFFVETMDGTFRWYNAVELEGFCL